MSPAASADHVLAIDCGTQSLRALVVGPTGADRRPRRGSRIEPYVSPHPGWAEQDPEIWWRALGEATPSGPRRSGACERDALAGVTLTTQRASIVVVDAAGDPLRPAIVWLDQRRTEGLPPVGGPTGLAFRALGVRETVAAFQADAEVNWIRRHEPEVWARTAGYLLVSGFLTRRLVGRKVDSVGCQVGYLPFDYRRLRWSAPSRLEVAGRAGRPGDAARARPADRPARRDHARRPRPRPGSRPACRSSPPPPTRPARCSASGALEPTIGALSFGTTATFNTTHRRYVEAIPMIPPYPAAVPGAYSLEINVMRGYWMVEWFKREFGDREVARAADEGVAPEALFDELVRAVPPGSMGLTLQPYWSPGVRIPGPEAKGAIIGWGDVHTRAHLYRAILEGLAYALREGAERTEQADEGVTLTELRVSGGGSQSPAAVQLTADVFGLPTARPHTYETSGLGAAIDAAVGLGIHPSFEAAVGGDDPAGRGPRAGSGDPPDLRRALSGRLPADVPGAQSRSTPRSAGSRRGTAAGRSGRLDQAAGPGGRRGGLVGRMNPAPGVGDLEFDSAPGKKKPSSMSPRPARRRSGSTQASSCSTAAEGRRGGEGIRTWSSRTNEPVGRASARAGSKPGIVGIRPVTRYGPAARMTSCQAGWTGIGVSGGATTTKRSSDGTFVPPAGSGIGARRRAGR